MKLKLFRNRKEAEDHAAYIVAIFWLKSASEIIRRGEKPVRLSKCYPKLVDDEKSREIYGRFSKLIRTCETGHRAIQYALWKLHSGDFRSVREHFEIVAQSSEQRRIAEHEINVAEGNY